MPTMTPPKISILKIAAINIEDSPHVRVEDHKDVIEDYAEAYKKVGSMPPIAVFLDNHENYLLADGWHRLLAQKELGRKVCAVELHTGGYRECLNYAFTANAKNGLRMSNDDKRRAVSLAMKEYPEASNRQLAEIAGVSHVLVNDIMKESQKTEVEELPRPPVTPSASKPDFAVSRPTSPLTTSGTQPANRPQETPPAASAKPTVDTMGYPIPIKIQPTYVRAHEIREQISTLRAVLNLIRDVGLRRDPLWMGLNFQDFEVGIKRLTEMLRAILPEVVCTHCQGHPETAVNNNCPMCHGKGFISHYWFAEKGVVPVEVQALREKQIVAFNKKHLTVQSQAAQVAAVA